MQINTEFVVGKQLSYEFKRTSNQLSYDFVLPKTIEVEFTRGKSLDIAFIRPNNTLAYEFTIGKQGPQGDDGNRGSLWTSSSSNPSNSFGEETDMHLNYATYDLYQKLSGQWQLVGNIKGPTGPAGDGEGILPTGGTIGQKLAKASATDFDVIWVDTVDSTYVFTQASALATWNIPHFLRKYPSVFVVDSGGNHVHGDLLYVDDNNVTLTFSGGFSGKAYLN